MSEKRDLQSLIWLINAEIANAVNTVHGGSESLAIDKIKVKMGQSEPDRATIPANLLATQRYPLAQNAWLLELEFSPRDIDIPSPPKFWQGLSKAIPVYCIQGVGKKRAKVLSQFNIETIGDLGKSEVKRQIADFRQLQTLANTALTFPPIAITDALRKFSALRLLDDNNILPEVIPDQSNLNAFIQWLQMIEVCVDKSFLRAHSLDQLTNWQA
ncbi:hypothetical protein [Agaribacter flavus]|uniref:Uncharacterized protein n=1 Tax=Agaribacter flavus TaxID=1902781 RepID=A0ABV7FUN7_9ALTE